MSERTNKLNIALIKAEFISFDQIVIPEAKRLEVPEIGTFFVKDSYARPPDWVNDFFVGRLEGEFRLLTSSASGVFLVRIERPTGDRIFAMTFGQGRYLLIDGAIEERFGLKVVLNSVLHNSLRSIDKTVLGTVPKQSRELVSREGEAAIFGIDIEQDLVNAVTGRSKDPRLGKMIAGRDSLAASVKVSVREIKEFVHLCLECYESDAYKADFEWIDQIQAVKDPHVVDQLNSWLVDRIANLELEKIWMAPPDPVDWVDIKGFRYSKSKNAALFDDIDLTEFLSTLGETPISLHVLKARRVFAVSSKSDDAIEHWTAYNCCYAEASLDGFIYVLNRGKWYKIAAGFSERILNDFANFPESDLDLPPYNHINEAEYNKDVPNSLGDSCCMDCKLIAHGGGHSTIEFCDIFTGQNRLIHVKRYSGSAQLSHLFNQGVVSGELFMQDGEFRVAVNEKLPDTYKFANPHERPDPKDFEIIFAIISRSENPLEIPFFSKVSLRNARRRLEGYGYKVKKKKILNLSAAA